MSTTTTTTEISSNSNSSCRLLVCLNTLPFHDLRVFRSLLGHTGFLRLSACCHSLRNSIRNDQLLWQALYHRDFLSGAHYAEEMDFVLWCIRTDVNNLCTSDKRAGLLENVDWYNTYRRRVSTENNWRYGRCNTTYIDMETCDDAFISNPPHGKYSRLILTTKHAQHDEVISFRNYEMRFLPHPNLNYENNKEQENSLSTSPNILSLNDEEFAKNIYSRTDYCLIAYRRYFEKNSDRIGTLLSHRDGKSFGTFCIPNPYKNIMLEGKWMLLNIESRINVEGINTYERTDIMVLDIENNTMCSGKIDDTWSVVCFYKTTNNTAVVYTARLVKDDKHRAEWALYQFSSNNHIKQLRNGWFYLPDIHTTVLLNCYSSCNLQMRLQFHSKVQNSAFIMHSVASSSQDSTPRDWLYVSYEYMPTSLLQAGFNSPLVGKRDAYIWTDTIYSVDRMVDIPDTTMLRSVIGNLYLATIKQNSMKSTYLVDITTGEKIRKLDMPNMPIETHTMISTISAPINDKKWMIQEYGEA